MSIPAFICSPMTTVCAGTLSIKTFTPPNEAFENAVERMAAGGVRVCNR